MAFTQPPGTSPPHPSSSVTTSASTGADNDTAQPALTSGFGAVIAREHELQAATEGCLQLGVGPYSEAVDRVLREQGTRLAANIALLEQRYATLPAPTRFHALTERHRPPAGTARRATRGDGALPVLLAQHERLLADIDTLIHAAPDGQRGELILVEIGRNHEEMASVLGALVREDKSRQAAAPTPPPGAKAEAVWDNEGGQ